MSQRAIEVRVGILILVAMGLLGSFVVVMGGLSFEPTYTVYVDFQNPGALQSGSAVRLAGVKVGRVSEMQFRGGLVDENGEPELPIRVVAKIEKKYSDAIRENARFIVTSQGVLGELFLSIEPGSHDRPVIKDGAIVTGVSPPRLDLLLSESYELLHRAYKGITENDEQIGEMFDGLHATLKGTGKFFEKNDEKLDKIVDNVEELTAEGNDTLKAARKQYIDNPRIKRIVANVDRTTASISRDVDPLLRDSRKVMSDATKLTETLASDEQRKRYAKITNDVSQITGRAKHATADAQAIVAHVKRGKGTVGAFVMDEAVYDDVQELLRDLKHNPWKIFWRE